MKAICSEVTALLFYVTRLFDLYMKGVHSSYDVEINLQVKGLLFLKLVMT